MSEIYVQEAMEFENQKTLMVLVDKHLIEHGWRKEASDLDITEMANILEELTEEVMAVAADIHLSLVSCIKLIVSLLPLDEAKEIDAMIDPVLVELHRRSSAKTKSFDEIVEANHVIVRMV